MSRRALAAWVGGGVLLGVSLAVAPLPWWVKLALAWVPAAGAAAVLLGRCLRRCDTADLGDDDLLADQPVDALSRAEINARFDAITAGFYPTRRVAR